jgi:putative tryptophan/tyrosine transport system substrate-binding protein
MRSCRIIAAILCLQLGWWQLMFVVGLERRQFLTLIGGAASTWPLAARAQQFESVRRIGVLMGGAESDPAAKAYVHAFQDELAKLGWPVGRNVEINYRWAEGSVERIRRASAELVTMGPSVILAVGSFAVRAFLQITQALPVVFVGVAEPVSQGFVASLARPGGNVTGFANLDWTFGAKWLEMLKEIAPRVRRVALIFNPDDAPYEASFVLSAETAAARLAMEPFGAAIRQPADLEDVMASLARERNGGLIVLPDNFTVAHRKLIVTLAARYRLPAIYAFPFFLADGGLVSYGVDIPGQFRLAAGYIDRILRGEKPADLPVQQPTRFELVINIKTAAALGLDVPPRLRKLADTVIE